MVCLFFSCKKETTENPAIQDANVVTSNNALQRQPAGNQTYYSTDEQGNYYKMDLKWDASGNVEVDRKKVTSGYPLDVVKLCLIDSGVPYTETDTTIIVKSKPNKHFYQIPFSPGKPFFDVNGGGQMTVYCQATCNDLDGICKLLTDKRADGSIKSTCPGNCKCAITSDCWIPSGGGGSSNRVELNTGAITIEAKSISVKN